MCTRQEVHEELAMLKDELKEEFLTYINRRLTDTTHCTPSQETLRQIAELRTWIEDHKRMTDTMNESMRDITRALFGDKDRGEIGIVQQNREVYEKVLSLDGIKGFFKWILMTGGVVGMLYTVFKKF